MKKHLVFFLLALLSCPSFAIETGAADTVYRVPSAGGRPTFGSTLKKITINGLSAAQSAKTGAYTLTATDDLVVGNASGGTFTLTLPTASSVTNKIFKLKKAVGDTSFNAITVSDGTFSTTLNTFGETVDVQSDGTTYQVTNRYIPSTAVSFTPTFTGLGTVTNIKFYWRRLGNMMQIQGSGQCGTTTAAAVTFTIPSGPTFDTTSLDTSHGFAGMGTQSRLNTSAALNFNPLTIISGDTNKVTWTNMGDGSSSTFNALLGSTIFANSSYFGVQVMVPITGWNG